MTNLTVVLTDLTVVIGNYLGADHAPVVAEDIATSTAVVFCDHRHTPAARAAVIAPLTRNLHLDGFDVYVVDPPTGSGCTDGYHQWEREPDAPALVEVRCRRCGVTEAVTPMPVPAIVRRLRAS